MATLNNKGYVEHRTNSRKPTIAKATKRDWWIVKYDGNRDSACISLPKGGKIFFPREYLGKRVRLKIEVIPDGREE